MRQEQETDPICAASRPTLDPIQRLIEWVQWVGCGDEQSLHFRGQEWVELLFHSSHTSTARTGTILCYYYSTVKFILAQFPPTPLLLNLNF